MQKNNNLIESYENYSLEGYNTDAMALMWQQQKYNLCLIEKYVIRGSIMSCLKGLNKVKIDMLEDKGIYCGSNSVCTTDDCKVGENIHDFCTCHICHENYGHKCVPELVGNWQQTTCDLLAYNQDKQEYVEILKGSAVLVCGRGGYITIDEVPIPLAEAPSEPACYETHKKAFQYSKRDKLYTYVKSELEHFVECMDKNLIVYNDTKKKYQFDMDKYYKNYGFFELRTDDSESFIKLYIFFKAEIIMREYDLIMEKHYKNWLIDGKIEDVTQDITNLCKKNAELIINMRNKFMSQDEVTKKITGFLSMFFFKDLVNTDNIWDIKSRVVVMNFSVNNVQLQAIKDKITEESFNEVLNGTVEYDEKEKTNKFTLRIEPYGKKYYIFNGESKSRDYYGNYHYGYVGAAFYSYREDEVCDFLLLYSDLFQRLKNATELKWGGDPEEDKVAISDGCNAYLNPTVEDSKK